MRKGVVVDLDGTFIRINSFERFFIFMFKHALVSFKLNIVIILLFLIIGRKFRLYSHAKLKYYILKYVRRFDEQMINGFVKKELIQNINNDVLNIIMNYKKKGYFTYLSTAAPAIYVIPFCNSVNVFDNIVCTEGPLNGQKWEENLGEVKLRNTIELLNDENCSLDVVITDHSDDIPLLRNSKEINYLVSPSENSLYKINAFVKGYKII